MEILGERFGSLSVACRLAPSEPAYILDVACQPAGGPLVAASCSDGTVRLHQRHTLAPHGAGFKGHAGPLCGVRFAQSSPDTLYSGSTDGTLRCWDARQPGGTATRVFRSDASHVFCCMDLSCNDMLLCGGTEQVGEDSFLVFWDVRMATSSSSTSSSSSSTSTFSTAAGKQQGLLGVYSESHSDDITAVRFHPRQADRVASGGTDGLVNVFQLNMGAEEDALTHTCNTHSSAASLAWAGSDYNELLCVTHDEGLCLWDVRHSDSDSDDPLALLSVPDARTHVSLPPAPQSDALEYLVGGAWMEEAGQLLVVGGAGSGALHLIGCCGREGLRPLRCLEGGHSATVRCFLWLPLEGALLTGGEDGQLLLWRQGGAETQACEKKALEGVSELQGGRKDTLKSVSSLQLKARSHRKHHSNSKHH
ncbi:WD repeat-containing protein 89 [Engraulis encrasicolus]|uniref:WD repeat-containing protein 89 n=1 Tax=Engraulis encrasicolus TaxID=184585 RepID=UPI002FD56CCD